MPCSICGASFQKFATGFASYRTAPTCKCGSIRKRERAKGCPVCGAQDMRIQMKKLDGNYMLTCTCGTVWSVRE